MNRKKLLIAGSRSGVGKTTISLGIMRAFKNRGLKVQPFKVGPDYIDPGFHTIICENNSYNLDSYFLGHQGVEEVFSKNSTKADISIIEGVMGLYDGKGNTSNSSSAEIAKIINAPVILIIDAAKIAQSAAAIVHGYKNYDKNLNLQGIIVNNISSEHHYELIKNAVETNRVGVEVLGYLPRDMDIELPERHLGLVPATESQDVISFADKLSSLIEQYIDLDRLEKISASTENEINEKEFNLNNPKDTLCKNNKSLFDLPTISSEIKEEVIDNKIKIGVAYDCAFNFYYQSNLDILKDMGAEIIYFSPISDHRLPEVDFVYIGGGFPENFLKELSENIDFKKDFLSSVRSGIPIYAECGGLMYLCNNIKNFEGEIYEMCSIIPAKVEMKDKLQDMGYREVESIKDNLLLKNGEKARGHVFHYSKLVSSKDKLKLNYKYRNSMGGYSYKENVLASYLHLHFASNPKIVMHLLESAIKYKKIR